MTQQLVLAFEGQLEQLALQIAEERNRLAVIEDREAAAIARDRITSLETLVAKISDARAGIFSAEAEYDLNLNNFAKWRDMVAEIRDAVPRQDKRGLEIKRLDEELERARDIMQVAKGELARHDANVLGPLALEREKHAHEKTRERLVANCQNAIRDMQEISARRDPLWREWFAERNRLDHLRWQEERLRPLPLKKLVGNAVLTIQ